MKTKLQKAVRVCVISPKAKRHASLCALLRNHRIQIEAECGGAELALERAKAADVILLELNPANVTSIEVIRQLKTQSAQSRIVVLASIADTRHIIGSFEAGADGYLLKSEPAPALVEAVLKVAQGGAVVSSAVLDRMVGHFQGRGICVGRVRALSPREREIFQCLVDGLAYKQIAEGFGLKVQTINWHVKGIYQKMSVHSRAELVAAWRSDSPP